MNDRIRELSEQAWDSARDHVGGLIDEGGEVNWDFLHTYDEKFSELIIRKCMELGDKALQDGKWPGDVLKEHFGVEE